MGVILERKKRILLNEPHIVTTTPAGIANFSTDMIAPLKSCKVEFSPVQSGSGDPSPDNVRPISGWTGAQVWDDPAYGGNINWNQLVINGNYESTKSIYGLNGTLSVLDNVGQLTPNGQYSSTLHYGIRMGMIDGGLVTGHKCFIRVSVKSTKANKFRMRVSNAVAWSSSVPANTWTSIVSIITVTTYNELCTIYAYDDALYTTNDQLSVKQCMVIDLTAMFGAGNEPATAAEFEELFPNSYYPYNTGVTTCVSAVNGDEYRHIPITFPSEAGTVYGGYVDLVTGELVATMASVDLGSLSWSFFSNTNKRQAWYTSDIYFKRAPNANTPIVAVCDIAKAVSYNATWEPYMISTMSSASSTGLVFTVNPNEYSDSTEFTNAVSGVHLAYELATPITYQLTSTQLKSLRGVNNIWSDANGDTTVKYWTH